MGHDFPGPGEDPRHFPKWKAVYNDFVEWRDDGTRAKLDDVLRAEVRSQAGREPTPSAGSIDSQTVKATGIGGPRGLDGGEQLDGRKRHVAVDTPGLILESAAQDLWNRLPVMEEPFT